MTLLKMDSAAQFYFRYQQWPLSLPCIYMAGSGYYAYRMANSFGTLWGKICFFEREQTITIRCQEKLKQVIYLWGTCCNWLWCNKISNFQMTECHQTPFSFSCYHHAWHQSKEEPTNRYWTRVLAWVAKFEMAPQHWPRGRLTSVVCVQM